MKTLLSALAGVLMLVLANTASAAPVTWYLTATLNDGGTASGSYVYDAASNTYSNFNIVSTTGTQRNGDVYTVGGYPYNSASFFLAKNAGESAGIYFYLVGPMSGAGGTILLSGGQEWDCATPNCGTGTNARTMTSGSITTTAPPAPPAITSLSPSTGPSPGGYPVVITGTDFTGATAVTFGGTAAASFTVNSDTQITAVAPAGAVGPVDVAVTTPDGTSANTAADDFTYTVPAVPTLTEWAMILFGSLLAGGAAMMARRRRAIV